MPSAAAILATPFGRIADCVADNANAYPARRALDDGTTALTYPALDALMDRIAAALLRDGLQPRDVIAICATPGTRYAALFLGALRAGVAVAPLSPGASPASLARMVQDSDSRLLFVDRSTAATLAEVPGTVRRIDLSATADPAAGQAFDDWLATPGRQIDPLPAEADWPFNIIYSSGTTGEPKGIVQGHGMRWAHVQRGTRNGYDSDAVTLLSTPLYSNTTLVSFFPTLALGGTVLMMPKFDAGAWLALAERERVTHAMLVPVQYQRLLAHPDFAATDLSSFRAKYSTSAPFPAALKAAVVARWPGALIDVYGMTEGGGTCMLDAGRFPDKLHTVGRPVDGHDIRLIDADGNEVGPGEAGEVVGHSPGMMAGYHKQPQKTREAEWFAPDGKRFIRTGDIGRFDADGFLTIIDRSKDMIISGGFNLYPSDLEAVLAAHPAVAEAAVVGVPSTRWGETPVAFVVRRPGGATPSDDELLAWTNARLGKTQRLAGLRAVDTLPRSPIGKVLKRELRDRWDSPLP